MKIVHLTNSLLEDVKTGYTVIVEGVFAKEQRRLGHEVEIFDVSNYIVAFLSHKINKEYLFEILYGMEEYKKVVEEVSDDVIELLEIKNPDLIIVNVPVSLPPKVMRYLTTKNTINIAHDIAPLISHNNFWEMEAFYPLQSIKDLRSVLLGETECQGFEKKYSCMKFFESIFPGIEPCATVEGTLLYMKYLRDYVNYLKATPTVVPSGFMSSIYGYLGIKTNIVNHPMTSKILKSKKSSVSGDTKNIISIFTWEKFDLFLYLAIVRDNPDYTFYLIADDKTRNKYLEPIRTGYGYPKNMNVIPFLTVEEHITRLNKINPVMFMHLSSISESYGLIVDEMAFLNIPTLLIGNESAISERVLDSFINVVEYKSKYGFSDLISDITGNIRHITKYRFKYIPEIQKVITPEKHFKCILKIRNDYR